MQVAVRDIPPDSGFDAGFDIAAEVGFDTGSIDGLDTGFIDAFDEADRGDDGTSMQAPSARASSHAQQPSSSRSLPSPSLPSASLPSAPRPSPSLPLAPRPLAEVLAALGDRVAPISMARERTLPTSEQFAGLFTEGGLVRGRVLSCTGVAATSLALGLISRAVAEGSWVALIDVSTIGLDAANELGVPLERVVAIDTGCLPTGQQQTGQQQTGQQQTGQQQTGRQGEATSDDKSSDAARRDAATRDAATRDAATRDAATRDAATRWADAVAAAADGFDVMIARVPQGVRAGTVRKVATRLQQRGVVMIVLGDPGLLVCDGVLDTTEQAWSGLGNGWGHLRQRSVEVSATGRRLPGRRCQTMVFPSAHVGIAHVPSVHTSSPLVAIAQVSSSTNTSSPAVGDVAAAVASELSNAS